MRRKPRLFSSALSSRERLVYGAVTVVFVVCFLATMWPVYASFSRVRPLVLGVPLSLAYLVGLVGVSFFTLLGLYTWERRHGKLD